MSRYIDADLLIKIVEHWKPTVTKESFIKALKSCKTADVAEVRHGHWVQESFIAKNGEKMYHTPYCSVCNRCEGFKTKYCPNCGAKMDGERREDET